MAVYVVTWDLNKEKRNYNVARAAFIKHLEAYENTKDSGLDSVRFISTTDNASEIKDYLRQTMDDNDTLFVSRVRKGERAGWLRVWDWIKARE